MRFLIDNALSPLLATLLNHAGHDALHVRQIALQQSEDAAIFDRAAAEDRIVISADTDFGTLLAMRATRKPSVIQFRGQGSRKPEALARTILSNLSSLVDPLDLIARDGRKGVEELIEAVVALKVINQVPEGHPSPDEDRRSAEDMRVAVNDEGCCWHSRFCESGLVCFKSVVGNPQLSRDDREPRIRRPQLQAPDQRGGQQMRIDPANPAAMQSTVTHEPDNIYVTHSGRLVHLLVARQ